MKRIILSLILAASVLSVYAQSGSQAVSGIKYRVNDTTTYQSAVATAHSQGYADIYFNNQATRKHWDIWNAETGSYEHVFDFNDAGGGGGSGTVNSGTAGQIAYYAGSGTAVSGLTTGTGVTTALGVNVGSAGSVVVNGGALGTPSSGTLTNATGLPLTTGVTGILPIANGGTNANTQSSDGIAYFNGTSITSDATKFFWDGSRLRVQNAGVGAASPQTGTLLHLVSQSNTFNSRFSNDSYVNTQTIGSVIQNRTARGTISAPTASQTNDIISAFNGVGYKTTGFGTGGNASMTFHAGSNMTDTNAETYIVFRTTPNASTTLTERFRIGSAGQLGIGGANFGAANALFTSGGSAAAPTWTSTGTGVLTFLGTPSWTNFLSAITGTAPYWALTGTSTLTGVATITSNAHSQHVFDGTWTATANNQNHWTWTPSITGRAANTGDIVRGINIAPSFTAGSGSNTTNNIALNIQPSWNDNGTSGAIHSYIRAFDGTTARFQVTDANVTIASSSNTLTITNGAAGPQLSSSSGSLQLNSTSASGNVLMQIAGNSWFGVQSSNQIGASLFAVSGTVSSTATQNSSRRLNWQVNEWTGSASQINYWTAKATQSTATNQLSYWDLSFGTTGSAPSETNLYIRVRNTDGNVLLGATTNTSFTPNVTLDNVGGMATRHTTKSQITADQNDYAIGVQTAFRMSSDASRNVTGLTGGVDGKWLIITNVGAQDIVFTNEDAASTAANRITSSTGANITVSGGHTITFIYDATTSRWRDIAFR